MPQTFYIASLRSFRKNTGCPKMKFSMYIESAEARKAKRIDGIENQCSLVQNFNIIDLHKCTNFNHKTKRIQYYPTPGKYFISEIHPPASIKLLTLGMSEQNRRKFTLERRMETRAFHQNSDVQRTGTRV